MRYNVYGRFQVEVVRQQGRWKAFKLAPGIRRDLPNIVFPDDLMEDEIATFLDDIFHELARPGDAIELIAEG